jgi:hypothetical protein
MKKKEIHGLEKRLLGYLPGFSLKGSLMILSPVRPVLRGIAFDSSGFDKTSFTVNAFLLPLCIPTSHLYFNFGNRIRRSGGGDRWDLTKSDLVAELGMALKLQAAPFLSRVTSLLDFVVTAIAYSLARSGLIAEAVDELDLLLDQLDETVPWQLALADEAGQLKVQLIAHPTEALRQLETWQRNTEQRLGLNEADGSQLNGK